MLTAPELDSKVFDDYGFEGQLSLGEDEFYQKYEEDIKRLTEKFMPPKEEDARSLSQYRQQMEQYVDYRNYLTFSMYEKVEDENGNIRKMQSMIWQAVTPEERDRTRNMSHCLQALRCSICSRQTVILRSVWCFLMKHFPRWIRSEAKYVCIMRESWSFS